MVKMPLPLGITLTVVLLALGLSPHADAGNYALLIGISDYSETAFNSLGGPLNDLTLLKTVLTRRFNIPTDQIRILTNAQATHTSIKAAFSQLAGRIRPGDCVYIHYSGHGSETKDLNHDEPGGMDQTWVSYGARSTAKRHEGLNDFDIIDDELCQWLIPIAHKSAYVVFVSDSCHSATVTRGPAIQGRALPADPRHHPQGRQKSVALPSNVLRIGAAMDDQTASEFMNDEGGVYGLFTWNWCQALSDTRPHETWDDVFQRACLCLANAVGWRQHPQRTGAANRSIFNGAFKPPSKVIRVTGFDNNKKTVKLNAGMLSGVTRGSIYQAESGSTPPVELKITRVYDTSSKGRLHHGSARVGDGFVERIHIYPFKPVRIFVNGDYAQSLDKGLIQRLCGHVANLPEFEIAADQARCDLVLYILRPQTGSGQSASGSLGQTLPQSIPQADPQVWFLSPDERLLADALRIGMTDITKGIGLVEQNLRKLLRLKEMEYLPQTPVEKFAISLQTTLYRLDSTCQANETGCISLDPQLGMHRKQLPTPPWQLDRLRPSKNDVLGVTLTNRTRQTWFTYLVEIQPVGRIIAIFPAYQDMASMARLSPGQSINLLYDAGVGIILDHTGRDKLRFIATRAPINIRLLEQQAFKTRSLNPIEQLLINAAHGTRGEAPVAVADWQSVQIEFQVH